MTTAPVSGHRTYGRPAGPDRSLEFVNGAADWLGGWAQDFFTMDTDGLRVILDHGLSAAFYPPLGRGIAARLDRA